MKKRKESTKSSHNKKKSMNQNQGRSLQSQSQSQSFSLSSNQENQTANNNSTIISPIQLSSLSAHRSNQTIHSVFTDGLTHSGDSHKLSSHLSISPSFSRPKLIRHLLLSTPDSYSSPLTNYQSQQTFQQQNKHQKSHTYNPIQNSATSLPSNSIIPLSRSLTRPHLSNLTGPLRAGLPLISVALSHQSNHSHHHHHHHHQYRLSSHHHQLKQLIAVASRTEIRVLEVINQHHSPPIEASHIHQTSTSSPILGNNSRNEIRMPGLSRSLDSTTTINDRLAIKLNSELGPSYGVYDLSWGYASTTSHLAAACTNGSIVLWDIHHPLTSHDHFQHQRLFTFDHVHNRAINKISFAGPTGHWVASGAQDSLIKIWDVREGARPTMILTTHSDPVRQLRFFPDRTANPFDLFVLTDSGTLSQFDLRQQKSCLARRVAHASTGVGLDWFNDGTNSLLASAGADGIVKIWNMAESILPTTPMRTLIVGRSICGLAWRPGYATQLVITPSSAMADFAQHSYSDFERASGSSIMSNYPDDPTFPNKGIINATATRSASDTNSESSHLVGGDRHSELLIWDLRRQYIPEMIIRGRDGPASGMVWLSSDLLLTIHKRASAIVQHDVGQSSHSKYSDMLPSQALSVSKKGSICFSVVNSTAKSHSKNKARYSKNADEVGSAMVHGLSDLKPPDQFEFLALNYKFEDKSFEAVCDHNAELCRRVGQPELWQLWNAVKLWFSPRITAALMIAQDSSAETSNGNYQLAIAMAMRRVLNEESSDDGEPDYNKSGGGDMESSSCGRRSSSQDQTVSRKNSATGKSLLPDLGDNKRDESVDSRSGGRSPIPNLDRASCGHRAKLSASSVATPSVLDSSEPMRKPSSRLSSATTPKAQMRSCFFGGNSVNSSSVNPEGSLESAHRRPTALRTLAIDHDHSPLSSPDTEGAPSRRSIGGPQIRTDKTPDGAGHNHLNDHLSWRSMSKDRIAAKMHARGASFNELGSLIQAIGADKILSDKKTQDHWKNHEEKQSVEIEIRQSIIKILRNHVELNGNVQLGVYLIGILKLYHYHYHNTHHTHHHQDQSHEDESNKINPSRAIIVGIDKELLDDRLKSWIRVYIASLRRNPRLLVLAAEIKLRFFNSSSFGFSVKEIEDQSLKLLRLNPSCGNCGKVLTNSSHHQSNLTNNNNNNSNNQSLTMMMMLNNHKKKMLNNNNVNSNPNLYSNLINNYYNSTAGTTHSSSHNLKCDKCQFNVLRCCFCHESIKFEPLIICLKCGHGIHLNCLNQINSPTIINHQQPSRNLIDIKNENQVKNDIKLMADPSLNIHNRNQNQNIGAHINIPTTTTPPPPPTLLQCPSGCGCVGCFYSDYF